MGGFVPGCVIDWRCELEEADGGRPLLAAYKEESSVKSTTFSCLDVAAEEEAVRRLGGADAIRRRYAL